MNHIYAFLGQSPKIIEIKAKINKWGLTKLINFFTPKETINKMKRQPKDWKKKKKTGEFICKQEKLEKTFAKMQATRA